MVIVVPKATYAPSAASDAPADTAESNEAYPRPRERNRYWLGIGLVVAGLVILLNNLNILGLRSIECGILAAIAIIGLGAVLLIMSLRRQK